MQGNDTQKLLGYCNRLNNELGFNIIATSGGYVLRNESYASRLVDPLNDFEFGKREWNVVNNNNMNRFINRVQNENPFDRRIDYSDVKDFSDYQFSKWARTNNGVYNELTTRIEPQTLEQYKKANQKNIIQAIIRILNEHDFASKDNINHKFLRRIYQESLDPFTNRVFNNAIRPSVIGTPSFILPPTPSGALEFTQQMTIQLASDPPVLFQPPSVPPSSAPFLSFSLDLVQQRLFQN